MKLTATDLNQHIAQRHSPLVTRNGGARIDTEQLLSSGALTGPHRTTRPITLSLRQRVLRWLRGAA